MRRLFIGLWPKAATQRALQPLSAQAVGHCGGRALKAEQWHITLAFLGAVPETRVQQLRAQAPQWQLPDAPFLLDSYGSFPGTGIVWVGSRDSASLQAMQQCFTALWHYLRPLGFSAENRPFVPHVSLLRRAVRSDIRNLPSFAPFGWHNQACYLIESRPTAQGSAYYPLAKIPLLAGGVDEGGHAIGEGKGTHVGSGSGSSSDSGAGGNAGRGCGA